MSAFDPNSVSDSSLDELEQSFEELEAEMNMRVESFLKSESSSSSQQSNSGTANGLEQPESVSEVHAENLNGLSKDCQQQILLVQSTMCLIRIS